MTERVSDAGLQWFIGDHGPDTMAGRIARELLERREAERWIPVTERLPQKAGDYMTLIEPLANYVRYSLDPLVTDFDGERFDLANHRVAYWREIGPLPAPAEGESA